MNTISGKISEVRSHEGISLVKILSAGGIWFTSVLIDTPETAGYLKSGSNVKIHFKETEVMIAKNISGKLSIQNQVACIIQKVNCGVILCQLDLLNGDLLIRSVISSNACKQLDLSPGDKVVALIKSNEVSLSPDD